MSGIVLEEYSFPREQVVYGWNALTTTEKDAREAIDELHGKAGKISHLCCFEPKLKAVEAVAYDAIDKVRMMQVRNEPYVAIWSFAKEQSRLLDKVANEYERSQKGFEKKMRDYSRESGLFDAKVQKAQLNAEPFDPSRGAKPSPNAVPLDFSRSALKTEKPPETEKIIYGMSTFDDGYDTD